MTAALKTARTQTDDHPDIEVTPSLVPAIDEIIDRLRGRDLLSGSEVIDLLLDLRLTARAQDVLVGRD
jgi:hypothetical protein